MTQTAASQPAGYYTAEQVRELDRRAIHDHGIPGIQLMKRAGRAVFGAMLARFETPDSDEAPWVVICGAGNNAGDGYVIAGLAAERQIPVRVLYLTDPSQAQGDAARAVSFAQQARVRMQPFSQSGLEGASVIVDAMLGTGIQGDVRPAYADAITAINNSGVPVVAVDIPSGLSADTGRVCGVAIEAGLTVTFIGHKVGLVTGSGPAYVGECLFDDLDVPAAVYDNLPPAADMACLHTLLRPLRPRRADAHKGSFGHVMVIGGEVGSTGAAVMAAEMAARSGAGLTSLATRAEGVAAAIARCPEVMTTGVPSGQSLEPLLERPSVLVVGPGMGQKPWSEQMLHQAATKALPMVLDADALNIVSAGRLLQGEKRDEWILTPHPGEAARLLGCSVGDIQADRLAAATRLQQRYGGVVILKGAGTVIASPDGSLMICTAGNPGMASGGMGDVLSGLLGGLLAQGLSVTEAAQLGVLVHASAADDAAADHGQRGMLATDLIPYVRGLLNAVVSEE